MVVGYAGNHQWSHEAAAGLEQAARPPRRLLPRPKKPPRATTEAAGASEQGLKAAQEIAQAIEDIASQATNCRTGNPPFKETTVCRQTLYSRPPA